MITDYSVPMGTSGMCIGGDGPGWIWGDPGIDSHVPQRDLKVVQAAEYVAVPLPTIQAGGRPWGYVQWREGSPMATGVPVHRGRRRKPREEEGD